VPPQLTITTAGAYHLSNSLTLVLLALLSYRGGGWPQDSQAQVWGKKKVEGLTGRWQGTQIVSKAARGGMYSEAIGGHQCQIHSNWLSQSACLPALCRSVECDWTPVDMLCLPSSSFNLLFFCCLADESSFILVALLMAPAALAACCLPIALVLGSLACRMSQLVASTISQRLQGRQRRMCHASFAQCAASYQRELLTAQQQQQ